MGQLDQIFETLVAHDQVDLESLAIKMHIESEKLRRFIEEINGEMPGVILLKKNESNPYTSIWIPKEFLVMTRWFLQEGGWSTFYDEQHEKFRIQKEKEEREKQLSLENIEATTAAAKHAVQDAGSARRQSRRANWIAMGSLVVAALTFVFERCN